MPSSSTLGVGRTAVAAAILSAATLALFGFVDRFEISGDELLTDRGFAGDAAAWEIAARGGRFERGENSGRLVVAREGENVRLHQEVELPPRTHFVTASATATLEAAMPWPAPLALVSVYQLDDRGATRWSFEHPDLLEREPFASRRWSRTLRIAEGTKSVLFLSALRTGPATLIVAEPSLTPARERPVFRIARLALTGGWLLLFVVAVALAVPRRPLGPARVATLATGIAIVGSAVAPGAAFDRLQLAIGETLRDAAGPLLETRGGEPAENDVDDGFPLPGSSGGPAVGEDERPVRWRKVGHVLLFALLAGAARIGFPRSPARLLVVELTGFAVVTEVVQLLALDRSPGVFDVAIDLAGILVGLLVAALLCRTRESEAL